MSYLLYRVNELFQMFPSSPKKSEDHNQNKVSANEGSRWRFPMQVFDYRLRCHSQKVPFSFLQTLFNSVSFPQNDEKAKI